MNTSDITIYPTSIHGTDNIIEESSHTPFPHAPILQNGYLHIKCFERMSPLINTLTHFFGTV